MKKTLLLFTLAATAVYGVSLEDSLLFMKGDSLVQTTTFNTGGEGSLNGSGDFTVSFTLTSDAIAYLDCVNKTATDKSAHKQQYMYITGSGASHIIGIGQNFSSNTNYTATSLYTSTAKNVGGSTGEMTSNRAAGQIDLTTTDLSSVTAVAITVSTEVSGVGTNVYVSFKQNDGSIFTKTVNDSALKWSSWGNWGELAVNTSYVSSVAVFNSALGEADSYAINRELIPEPATATLSLLALAGLAARRRRK